MSDRRAFGAAIEDLSSAHENGTSLCEPFLRVLPITGVSISTLGAPFGSETVCASDDHAARLDELQFDLGEGPCWDAMSTRLPVLTPDLHGAVPSAWPIFLQSIGDAPVGALYAFPLALGSLDIGAVDLYSRHPGALSEAQIVDTLALASIVALQVLRRTLSAQTLKPDAEADDGYSRRVVHQATGMVLAQLGLSAADALLVIHGYAFSHGRSVREVAVDVVGRRLDFTSHLIET